MRKLLIAFFLVFVGCSGDTTPSNTTPDVNPTPDVTVPDASEPDSTDPDAVPPAPDQSGPAVGEEGGPCTADDTCNGNLACVDGLCEIPTTDPADWHTFHAGPFSLPSGEERFYCFSATLEEDIYTNEIVFDSHPVVHHLVFSKTNSPDPDGFFECDVLFQSNWIPIFIAGTGAASLTMPEGAGQILKKGTQLTAQLHLLNATLEDVETTVPLRFRKMNAPPEQPVEVVIFGNMTIALPPSQESEVVGDCASDSDMTIFSAFPHMHYMGRSMVVEKENEEGGFDEVFRRDPYDFDQQTLAPVSIEIKKGDNVKVICGFENNTPDVVTFGESSTNEMCFFIGFATKATHQLAGCIGGSGSSIAPEGCGEDPPNEIGLGAYCTEGGNECESGLMCTEDIEETKGLNLCLGTSCSTSSDCGEGGVCCKIDVGFQIELCLPPSCVFSVCEVQD